MRRLNDLNLSDDEPIVPADTLGGNMTSLWIAWMTWRAGRDDERGASLVEYALLVALIAVVAIAAVSFLGGSASTKFSTVGSSIQ